MNAFRVSGICICIQSKQPLQDDSLVTGGKIWGLWLSCFKPPQKRRNHSVYFKLLNKTRNKIWFSQLTWSLAKSVCVPTPIQGYIYIFFLSYPLLGLGFTHMLHSSRSSALHSNFFLHHVTQIKPESSDWNSSPPSSACCVALNLLCRSGFVVVTNWTKERAITRLPSILQCQLEQMIQSTVQPKWQLLPQNCMRGACCHDLVQIPSSRY